MALPAEARRIIHVQIYVVVFTDAMLRVYNPEVSQSLQSDLSLVQTVAICSLIGLLLWSLQAQTM
jgi:hypothetical protein